MNKKGVGPIGAVLLFIVFLVMWFLWLGAWINTVGLQAILDNNLNGIEAFFFANLNFALLICMILGMLGWMYFGGGNQ